MKKKYLFILTFAIFAILMFLSTGEVKATTNYPNTDLYIRTKIERWNDHNKDLVFIKNDDWGGNSEWYTKTVWITNSATGDPSSASDTVQITESMLDNEGKISLDYDDNEFSTEQLFEIFDNNEDVYLVEKYHINTADLSYTVGEWNQVDYLPCGDRLEFSFDNSSSFAQTVISNSMTDYQPESGYYVYVKALYDDEDVSANRNLNVYLSFEESLTKTTEKSQGTINLPVYGIEADLTASGNALDPAYFGGNPVGLSPSIRYIEPASSIGRLTGLVENSYDDDFGFDDLLNGDYDVYFNYGYLMGDRDMLSLDVVALDDDITEESNNTYIRVLTGSIERNQTAPNGIFYNILPFVIAGLVAIAGVVLIKKNSIKE